MIWFWRKRHVCGEMKHHLEHVQEQVTTVSAGDLLALQELRHFPAAFSQSDERGWYPLHRAVVQPLVPVLETVLYGG